MLRSAESVVVWDTYLPVGGHSGKKWTVGQGGSGMYQTFIVSPNYTWGMEGENLVHTGIAAGIEGVPWGRNVLDGTVPVLATHQDALSTNSKERLFVTIAPRSDTTHDSPRCCSYGPSTLACGHFAREPFIQGEVVRILRRGNTVHDICLPNNVRRTSAKPRAFKQRRRVLRHSTSLATLQKERVAGERMGPTRVLNRWCTYTFDKSG